MRVRWFAAWVPRVRRGTPAITLAVLALGVIAPNSHASAVRIGTPGAVISLGNMSADGRFVAFATLAPSPTETNPDRYVSDQVYLQDLTTGVIELVSRSAKTGGPADGQSEEAAVSDDGRFVAFSSLATNLVTLPPGARVTRRIYLRDRAAGTTRLVGDATSWPGIQTGGLISGDGSRVAWVEAQFPVANRVEWRNTFDAGHGFVSLDALPVAGSLALDGDGSALAVAYETSDGTAVARVSLPSGTIDPVASSQRLLDHVALDRAGQTVAFSEGVRNFGTAGSPLLFPDRKWFDPVLSPDGQYAIRRDLSQTFLVNLQSGQEWQLVPGRTVHQLSQGARYALASQCTSDVGCVADRVEIQDLMVAPEALPAPVAGSSSAPIAPIRRAVVLVPGLDENTRSVTPGGRCEDAAVFVPLCRRLSAAGADVWIVSSLEGGSGAVLDSRGSVSSNAARLRSFLMGTVRRQAFVVGHSMGGLIAREAIGTDVGLASGLFTIGTPHDGSYLADGIIAALMLPCRDLICAATKAGAAHLARGAAVLDMTQASRALANARLARPTVPTWTYAGLPGRVTSEDCGYVSPNDLAVGCSSAHGTAARLGGHRLDGAAWHMSSDPITHRPLEPNQFDDPSIAASVVGAAFGGLRSRSLPRAAPRSNLRATKRATASQTQTRKVDLDLVAARVVTRRGQRLRSRTSDVIAPRPFKLRCAERTTSSLALGKDLYYLPRRSGNCAKATLLRTVGGVVESGSPERVRVSVTRAARGKTLRVVITARRRVSLARVVTSRRSYSKRSRHSRVTFNLPAAKRVRVYANVAGARYVGMFAAAQ